MTLLRFIGGIRVLAALGLGLLAAPTVRAQTGFSVFFSNVIDANRRIPFRDYTGCYLDHHYWVELLVGPSPDFLFPLSNPVSFFAKADGETTGLFFGGMVPVPPWQIHEKLYGQARVWAGASTYAEAEGRGQVEGIDSYYWASSPPFEIPLSGPDAGKLVNMQMPFNSPLTVVLPALNRALIAGQSTALHSWWWEPDWNQTAKRWQKLDPETLGWVDLVGQHQNELALEAVTPTSAGWYQLRGALTCAPYGLRDPCIVAATWVGVLSIDGENQLQFAAPVGSKFQILTTDNLSSTTPWTLWSNVVMTTSSMLLPPDPNHQTRFYVIQPEYGGYPPISHSLLQDLRGTPLRIKTARSREGSWSPSFVDPP